MMAKFLFTTVQGSILLASILISISILISGGVIKPSGNTSQKTGTSTIQAAQPTPKPVQAAAVQPDNSKPILVSIAGDPILGDKNAKLTLVEFSDYECPFCKKAFNEVLPDLKKNYINTGKVRLIYKDLPLPFHQNAAKEAEAAQCAKDQGGDVAYFKYHDQIFTKTSGGGTGITLDQLPILAKAINLNVAQFQKCLDSGKLKAEVDKDLAEAQKVGAGGTPTWFLGKTTSTDSIEGTIIEGAQPFSVFKAAIDQQLSKIN